MKIILFDRVQFIAEHFDRLMFFELEIELQMNKFEDEYNGDYLLLKKKGLIKFSYDGDSVEFV